VLFSPEPSFKGHKAGLSRLLEKLFAANAAPHPNGRNSHLSLLATLGSPFPPSRLFKRTIKTLQPLRRAPFISFFPLFFKHSLRSMLFRVFFCVSVDCQRLLQSLQVRFSDLGRVSVPALLSSPFSFSSLDSSLVPLICRPILELPPRRLLGLLF